MSPIACAWTAAIILGISSAVAAAPVAGGLSSTATASAVFILLAMAIVHALAKD